MMQPRNVTSHTIVLQIHLNFLVGPSSIQIGCFNVIQPNMIASAGKLRVVGIVTNIDLVNKSVVLTSSLMSKRLLMHTLNILLVNSLVM